MTRNRISRRTVLRGVAASGGALSFPRFGINTTSAQSGQMGGMLRVSYNTSFKTLSPIKHLSNPEFVATGWMYNNLTRLDENRKPAPDLAESWEPKDEAKTWTFKLHEGVKFHNGREVTADDVAATFTAVLDPKNASPYRAELGPVDKAEATGKYSVKFTLRSSYADLPASLSVIAGRIVAQEGLSDMESWPARIMDPDLSSLPSSSRATVLSWSASGNISAKDGPTSMGLASRRIRRPPSR